MTTQQVAKQFPDALLDAEKQRSAEPLMRFFDQDSKLINLGMKQPMAGREEAEKFWQNYLGQFKSIRSRFSRCVVADSDVVLEWESEGELSDGTPINYRGVSLLSVESDIVREFRTYYDSAAFLEPVASA